LYKRLEEKGKKGRIKGKTMAQWINFFGSTVIIGGDTLLCEKIGAIALVLPGLMAGRQASQQADKIVLNLEIFKIIW